ncbi:galactokinase [Synchytrium endobioticum]|uniref:Galactokinase n=1 Tax=Synchytrium endobioticum TaxID=286115 RepID=A0A507D3M6_9FUNG|nr:galactokinase [Synchytrium endobioticum]
MDKEPEDRRTADTKSYEDDDSLVTPVTSLQDLRHVYGDEWQSPKSRYDKLAIKFRSRFGRDPTFFARSPGRVNLIGEHIDYSLFPVMPMAIDRDIVIAVATSLSSTQHPTITVTNTNGKYPEREFQHSSRNKGYVEIDPKMHDWANYFKCGYKGVFEELQLGEAFDMMVMVDGTVPSAAGVSSSSALVCCSALATAIANGKTMNKSRLTQTAIQSERYAGVQIGGMDQSSSIMGIAGSALFIDFYPNLKVNPITLPKPNPPPVFVIANTLVTSDKHITAPTNYNLRVVECRMAAALLAHLVGVSVTLTDSKDKEVLKPTTLRNVAEEYFKRKVGQGTKYPTGSKFEDWAPEVLSIEIHMSPTKIDQLFINNLTIHAEKFNLKLRAIHVLAESKRVYQFRDVCAGKPPSTGLENVLNDIGKLMNDSQASCKSNFECSCPELDDLAALARESGAYGSRLTGAGWGGCTVSLITADQVDSFIEKIKEGYYFKKWPEWRDDAETNQTLRDAIFASKPFAGAFVVKNNEKLYSC